MKTLDEVIKALRCTDPEVDPETKCNDCPYKEFRISDLWYVGPSCLDVMFADALHYLKHLQEFYEMSREHHEPNPALTWDELRAMKGKPIWVEYNLHLSERAQAVSKGWFVISSFRPLGQAAEMMVMTNNFVFTDYEQVGEWQAYRKERNEF